MNTIKYIFVALFACSFAAAQAQGLQGIVVERYYQANAADVSDATAQGALVPLTTGSVTYRVFVDMAAGYKFSQIYGSPTHALTVSSTANFYNDPNWGVSLDPGTVTTANIRKNTGMIDSWFTTGGTAVGKVGVRKTDDTDGSLGNAQSILANNPGSCFGSPINGSGAKDGIAAEVANSYLAPNALGLGSALDVLDPQNAGQVGSSITINDGAIAALGGVVGATADNLVLIGQFTTTGSLSFALNVQLINIATGVAENYVASSPVSGELTSASLTQTVLPTCPVVSNGNDGPSAAANVQLNTNNNYPNCLAITGTLAGATDSPESVSVGVDKWYRFTAQSSAVSITLTSSTSDDIIELYQQAGASYTLMAGGTENASAGDSDFERLNYTGLTPGTQYYVSVGSAGGTPGTFSLCIQQLLPSGCATALPVGGLNLCSTYRAVYRGATGVTYDFSFQGVGGGASGTTTLNGTNGVISLSNTALGLRYAGVYDVTVGVNYALLNSAGTTEIITVAGTAAGLCNDVTIMAQPNMEVRANQRCNATLVRGNWLAGTRVGTTSLCGATSYTYEFTQVVSCGDNTVVSVAPSEFTATSPYLNLGVLPNLGSLGAWVVRIRPNFGATNGSYGPAQTIQVVGTASASGMIEEGAIVADERSFEMGVQGSIYPNPSNGSMIALNFTDLTGNQVQVRIMDAMGREVFRSAYSVDGSLNQIISFDQTLAAGVYMVEMTDGSNMVSERMIVKN
ncbi:MAG: T9SS type A sorting domain-containing protein [Flavobacteriales bacterium]|jgi:hypothetical protein